MSAREYSHVINIFFVLVSLWVEVKRSRIRHVGSGFVRYDRDIIAYLVLVGITFVRIKRSADCYVG